MRILIFILTLLIVSCDIKQQTVPVIKKDLAKEYTIKAKQQLKDSADIIFYADLSRTMNQYRLYVLNIKDSLILDRGICLNGRMDKDYNVIYSNRIGSKCSSKGVYKIGSEYTGQFGKAFKLYGLDSTNSNAYIRHVVLHSYIGLSDNPDEVNILSEGCPTVTPKYLKKLSDYIKNKNVKYLIIN